MPKKVITKVAKKKVLDTTSINGIERSQVSPVPSTSNCFPLNFNNTSLNKITIIEDKYIDSGKLILKE